MHTLKRFVGLWMRDQGDQICAHIPGTCCTHVCKVGTLDAMCQLKQQDMCGHLRVK